MLVKQISIFVENKSGRLAEITGILADNNVNISALSIADTTDFGILRLIVNNPDLAEKALREQGLTVKSTNVIAVSVGHRPGGLAKALSLLNDKGISIEYMYAFTGYTKDNEALVIFRVEDTDAAVHALNSGGVGVLEADAVYSI